MSVDSAIAVIFVIVVACWYIISNRPRRTGANPPPSQPKKVFGIAIESGSSSDPFLDEIKNVKKQADQQVESAAQAYERELETRFSDDVQFKERLSQFAKAHELDQALIALYEKIKHYPAWAKRDDFKEWNELELSEIDGLKEGKKETVRFSYGGHRYGVSMIRHDLSQWTDDTDSYADFAIQEDGAEVFSIDCTETHSDYGTSYNCHSISAFKKRGGWAKMLIELYRRIQIGDNKSSSKFKYYGAEKIKERFEE